jgi:hypothetical protein
MKYGVIFAAPLLLAFTVKSAGRRSETAQMQSVMRMVVCKCPLQLQPIHDVHRQTTAAALTGCQHIQVERCMLD